MENSKRMIRRLVGLLRARLPELGLEQVQDPRSRRGRRWSLGSLMTSVIVGVVCGRRSLAETETLTGSLARGLRRLLKVPRRVPDTTARDALVRIEPEELRAVLRRQCRQAWRRKALRPVGLPCGVVSIDGKVTATPFTEGPFVQKQGQTYGVVRTLGSALVSSAATVCLDAEPIPPETNEMGHFRKAVDALVKAYGELSMFEVIMGDAGMCSLENATHINSYELGYIFRLKLTQPTLIAEAQRLLGSLPDEQALAVSEERDTQGRDVIRRVFLTTEMAGFLDWSHLRTVLRLQVTVLERSGHKTIEDRYYVSNLPHRRFSPEQWIAVFRSHWRIENACHLTWDKILREDTRPWIQQPEGMLVIQLLRRIAYNLLALFRSVTQRSDLKRRTAWRELLDAFFIAMLQADHDTLDGRRHRRCPATLA